jgi:hypothetical protein
MHDEVGGGKHPHFLQYLAACDDVGGGKHAIKRYNKHAHLLHLCYTCHFDQPALVLEPITSRGVKNHECAQPAYLKIETRLIDERFESVMGECDLEAVIGVPCILRVIRSVSTLARMLPTFDLSCEENAARR